MKPKNQSFKRIRGQASAGGRLAAALLAALYIFVLADGVASVRAQQTPAAKKSDAKDTGSSDQPEYPPPPVVQDNDWLTIEPFDVVTLAKAQFGEKLLIAVEPFEPRPVLLKPVSGKPPPDPKLVIRFYQGDATEYEVDRSRVVEIKYFEEMLLEQGGKYLIKGDMERAFEIYRAVAIRNPDWPGLDQKLIGFWMTEASRLSTDLKDERALQRLHEARQYCAARGIKPEPPDIKSTMGRVAGRVVDRAFFTNKNYVRARHYLSIFEADYPGTPLSSELTQKVTDWRQKLTGDAEHLVKQAKQKEQQGGADGQVREASLREASLAILQAADMWPSLPGIKDEFDRIYKKYPILHVAVRELPERFAPWAPAVSPDARVASLLHVPLMEVSAIGENSQFNSRMLVGDGELRLEEAGRRLTLTVKPGLRWSDGEKPITGMDLARSITARCDAKLASYDANLAGAVAKVSVPSINEVVVDLKRAQLRPQMNFLFNLAAGHRLQGDRFLTSSSGSVAVGAGPFRVLSKQTGVEASLQANQDLLGRKPKISEIVERRYASGRDAVNALLTGDVALIEHVPARQLRRLADRKELKTAQSIVPALHVISFDFRKGELHSRALRRAMARGLKREAILSNVLLEAPPPEELDKQRKQLEESVRQLQAGKGDMRPGEFQIKSDRLQQDLEGLHLLTKLRKENELLNGPFPRGTYAFDESIEPWSYNAIVAKGLVEVAKKELGAQGFQFTLTHPDTDEARDACKYIQEYWKLIGIEVTLQPMPTQILEEEVARGRILELVYRIHYVRDPLTDASRVLCLGQPISPEGMVVRNCASAWLRQNLRELELATNWKSAMGKLQVIQQQARDDVAIIPLWQLTDYYAYHERLHGVSDNSLAFYQGAENWQIDPWFRTDPK